MQILMLAAGESSRFWPFSERAHKSSLKVGEKSIIERVLGKLGGYEIIVVTNPKKRLDEKIVKKHELKIVEQTEILGMADAIIRSKDLIKDEFLVIMPYYINIDNWLEAIEKVKAPAIALKPYSSRDELTRGIVKAENGKILEIREKEKFEGATHSIIGIYKLNLDVVREIEKNKHDKTFEEIMNEIAKEGGLNYFELETLPKLKYVTDLLEMRDVIYHDMEKTIKEKTKTENSDVEKTVILGNNVKIGKNTSIKGNTFIGDNSFIGDNCLVRDCILGENTQIGFHTELARSIIMDNTHIHSGFVGDSIIGENCRIGANFITGNKRIDRGSIKIKVKDEDYDTGMIRLGVLMGDNVKTGINVSTMPGTLIGNNSIIGSNTEIKGRINSNKLVYSKTELLERNI